MKQTGKVYPKRPKINKLGTIACNNIIETTPIIYKGELYRFEVVRRKSFASENCADYDRWDDIQEDPCFRFIHVKTNASTPLFAEGHAFGFPWAEGDTMYVVTGSTNHWGSDGLTFFKSNDLVNWEQYAELKLPGWKTYNMNIAKKDGVYILMVEISAPVEECGPTHFTFRFFKSTDLTNWEKLPSEYVFQKDRYCGSPSIYAFEDDPYFYVGYLEMYPEARYANSIARSKDLINWEYSPINPVLMYDEDDRKIANPHLSIKDRERIASAWDINNSDMEVCEYLGRTLIYYSWGDQLGNEFLAEAWYEGPVHDFLRSFFEVL